MYAANLAFKVQIIGYREKENTEVGLKGLPNRPTSPIITEPNAGSLVSNMQCSSRFCQSLWKDKIHPGVPETRLDHQT